MTTDAYLFVNIASEAEIIQRLSPGWQEYLGLSWRPDQMPIRLLGVLP
ncbi:hypothetical protein ACWEK5_23410 [Rhodococcus koreensis]